MGQPEYVPQHQPKKYRIVTLFGTKEIIDTLSTLRTCAHKNQRIASRSAWVRTIMRAWAEEQMRILSWWDAAGVDSHILFTEVNDHPVPKMEIRQGKHGRHELEDPVHIFTTQMSLDLIDAVDAAVQATGATSRSEGFRQAVLWFRGEVYHGRINVQEVVQAAPVDHVWHSQEDPEYASVED